MNIYERINYYLENNKFIPSEFLLDYLERRIDEEELENYIDNVSMDTSRDNGYNPGTNEININPNEILFDNIDKKMPDINWLLQKKEKKSSKIKTPNAVNIYNLMCINHELAHAMQKKSITFGPNDLKKAFTINDVLITMYDICYFKSFYYKKYHDYFYKEYDANINSYLEIIYLLNSYNLKSTTDLIIKSNEIIAKHLIYLYSDLDDKKKRTTPVRNMRKLYKHIIDVALKHNIDLTKGYDYKDYDFSKPENELDRLRLGISISNDTYNYIKNVSIKKEKTLNLFDDIK